MSDPGDLWRRADEAFDTALDLAADGRARFLAELSDSDPELHTEVARLLDAHDRSAEFLDEAAPLFAASLLPDPPSSPDLPAGTRIGAYTIVERIGSGGMGVVYKAHDDRLDRFVALKFLAADPGTDDDARSRLLAEARIASALDHPGIAVVHEIAETDDHGVFVAMAFYEGATLRDRLRDGPLPFESSLDLAIQIAEALGAAHRNGIVHRDIKPANVIVTRDGVAKIVDFGIARIARITEAASREASEGTSTDPARGSPGYMSPEQRAGGEVDARADVWSFGVLLHEVLTGARPDDGVPAAAVPARFRPLLARCFAPDPAERYPDASALLPDLRAAVSGTAHGERARRRWPAVAAAVGILGVATATVLVMLDRSSPRSPPAATAANQGPIPGIDVTTSSLVAYRFYQEGRRSLASGDYHNAARLFDAALAEDSAFAMAAYYGWVAKIELGAKMPPDAMRELSRLAEGVSESERREIRGAWNGPRELAPAAEGAVSGDEPTDYRGFYARGRQRLDRGDFLGAVTDLRRAMALAPDAAASTLCTTCDVLADLQNAYLSADSLAAAARVLDEWIRREPGSARAWRLLAGIEVARQRYDEADEAIRQAVELSPGRPDDVLFPAMSRLPRADFVDADRLLADLARDGASVVRVDALWSQAISFRYQGRLREALDAIDRYAAASTDTIGALLHRAQVVFEMGRATEAAALFDSSANLSRRLTPDAWAARMETWSLTHVATATAALGDTSRLVGLADSIESVARRSTFGRDPFLHHHARGLLLAARGDREAAVEAFRRAIYSPTVGYTRTNVELGRILIELGRPLEAVAILQPAVRGGLEASNLYVTHTDLHDLLSQAWRAAGRADSAAAHEAWVLKAWENADPMFEGRRAAVRRRAGGDSLTD